MININPAMTVDASQDERLDDIDTMVQSLIRDVSDYNQQMVELIRSLSSETAILLIEHDMDAVFQLADRISVLVYGKVLTSGDAAHVKGHPEVQSVYLGTEAPACGR